MPNGMLLPTPPNIGTLACVIRINFNQQIGSATLLRLFDKTYVCTAAHVISGAHVGDNLGVELNSGWAYSQVEEIHLSSTGLDVAFIALSEISEGGLPKDRLDQSIVIGQPVMYCGYPLNMSTNIPGLGLSHPVPLFRQGLVSGRISESGIELFLVDGFNNAGFSGGPIFKNGERAGEPKLFAIVSGFKFDAPSPVLKRLPNGEFETAGDYWVRPNSGFVISIGINDALKSCFGEEAGLPV